MNENRIKFIQTMFGTKDILKNVLFKEKFIVNICIPFKYDFYYWVEKQKNIYDNIFLPKLSIFGKEYFFIEEIIGDIIDNLNYLVQIENKKLMFEFIEYEVINKQPFIEGNMSEPKGETILKLRCILKKFYHERS